MSAEEQQPSLAKEVAKQAAQQAARELAKKALLKVGAVLGAKAGVIIGVVLLVIALVVLLVVLIVSVAGAAFQSSTAVWPVPVATDTAGMYKASGWTLTSRFGWRDNPQGGGIEFHDGIDLANPQGTCPFGYHCGVPAMFDGHIEYVGWDMAASGDPSKTGGGELVILRNGDDDHETLYAHLEPYRLYVRLEGKITDSYDRDEYRPYNDYQSIGQGELKPDLSDGGISMWCANEMPNFIPTRTGPGSVMFLYDRPAQCRTVVTWGARGGRWKGWTPDNPPASDDPHQSEVSWATSIEPGKRAKDVALRFRAHLVPPDPPPSPTATPSPIVAARMLSGQPPHVTLPASAAVWSGQGSVAAQLPGRDNGSPPPATPSTAPRDGKPRSCTTLPSGWVRCDWAFADIPTDQERFAQRPDPWLVAAQESASFSAPSAEIEENDGPTIPPVQLHPTSTTPDPVTGLPTSQPSRAPVTVRTAVSTPTLTPAQGHTQGMLVDTLGVGGPRPRLLAAVPSSAPEPGSLLAAAAAAPLVDAVAQASISPSERVWIAPGGQATWTLTLANNQRGFWSVQVSPADARLSFYADTACSPSTSNSIICQVSGNTTTLHITVVAAAEADGLITDVLVPVSDADRGGSGVVVAVPEMRIAVGTPPTATPVPPTIPATPTTTPGSGGGSGAPDCSPLQLVRLPGVVAPQPKLVEPAAASFALVRAEIISRTGIDALAVLADVLRAPSFTTSKPGVLQTSWHKAGRAVDLNTGGPFVRVAEGTKFRLYLNNVDITAIFEAHGWQRIPVQDGSLEWWHYEWHPDGIAWTSAMLQVWDLPTLQAAFPEIAWTSIGCAGGSNSSTDPSVNPQEREQLCTLSAPRFSSTVEYVDGCGPPVRLGDRVFQLDSRLGYVGLSGATTGPHLHLGMKVRSYDGSWPLVDICTPDYLDGRTPSSDANCYTDMADPLAFLPRAPGSVASGGQPAQQAAVGSQHTLSAAPSGTTPTSIIPEGAPYQLPPPNYPNSLVFTPGPAATPIGQYWSPFADGGQYGGGSIGEWFCAMWSGWPWCN